MQLRLFILMRRQKCILVKETKRATNDSITVAASFSKKLFIRTQVDAMSD